MNPREKAIAAKLQQIPENKLTREVIIPLLDKMHYHRVEFNGGPAEQGKDIVFWDHDRMDEVVLYVAQVKLFKFTNTAADERSLQTIVNQLSDCFKRKLMYTDKSEHLPKEAWLITPYEVNSKTLQTTFTDNIFLPEQQIKIVDGLKLAALILKYRPESVKDLVGVEVDISSKISPTLNNKILLSALGFHEDKDLKSIYTDIDFSIGKTSTNLFFHSKFKPAKKKVKVNRKDWDVFRSACYKISSEYGSKFLVKSLEEIDKQSEISKAKIDAWRQKRNDIANKLTSVTDEINALQQKYVEYKNQWEIRTNLGTSISQANDPQTELLKFKKDSAYDELGMSQRVRIEIQNEFAQLQANEPDFDYEVELIGSALTSGLISKRQWIEERVANYNQIRPSAGELGSFIERCQSIITASSVIFEYPQYFNCIGRSDNVQYRKDFETTRFKFPIDQLFDTGLNFLVLGEAGAGKTTSLQMYTTNRENITDKIFFWLPLARLVQAWSLKQDLKDDSDTPLLENGIVKYLDTIGVQLSSVEFMSLHEEKKIVLLLDGLDEAIKVAPWLPSAINNITTRMGNNLQVIVTSRMSGSYISEIPFFALTLLPFTDEQRRQFIDRWFEKDKDDTIKNRINSHLLENKGISDIIRNPLLTTTLCVLARYGLPLPRTEITLYNERLKLLTGYYDSVKNIAARISVTPQILEMLAQKIAFHLHNENKREEDLEVLIAKMKKIMVNEMDPAVVEVAVRELFDPCNLMVPMSEDGKFGFGHLRYQEHLAAKEIINNRSIDIKPLLKQHWWAGVMVLFARMNTNLVWLVQELGKEGRVALYQGVINDMISARPKQEQSNLQSLMEKYLDLDLDTSVSFEDEY